MSAPPVLTPTEIPTVVRHWSVEERLTLLQAILQTLQGELPANPRPPPIS